jgi:hypothetical protein
VAADSGTCATLLASVECLLPGLGGAAHVEVIIGVTFPVAGVYRLEAVAAVSGSSDPQLDSNRATETTTVSQPVVDGSPAASSPASAPAAGGPSLPDTSQIWSESRGVILLLVLLAPSAALAIARRRLT